MKAGLWNVRPRRRGHVRWPNVASVGILVAGAVLAGVFHLEALCNVLGWAAIAAYFGPPAPPAPPGSLSAKHEGAGELPEHHEASHTERAAGVGRRIVHWLGVPAGALLLLGAGVGGMLLVGATSALAALSHAAAVRSLAPFVGGLAGAGAAAHYLRH